MGTKYLLENTQSGSSVTRALVYRWHIWVSDDLLAPLKLTVKHTIITSLTLNALQHYARKTVRGLALRNSITATFAHKIISVHMYMISGFSIIWNSFDCMVQWEGLGMSKTHQRNLLTWRLRRRSAPQYLQVMLFLCPQRLAKCSHVINILHVERNIVDVSSYVKSRVYLFHVAFMLSCLNSLGTTLVL